ncbi:MAG: bifunctional phosphopantothenoylcysteine decarboxylase/phosphopantothenate--cysteine ligase CoaBC [Propionibacteriaceae bacterium]
MTSVVLGIAGGIAAYKSAEVLRRMHEAGHEVTVAPTAASLNFVGAATWAALSGRPVHTDVFAGAEEVPHVRIGQRADLVVVAPATADLLARAASGRADDLLTNILLTARCPILMVPAMHTEMWLHPATRANVALLRERGVVVLDPASGRLTGADSGPGRLPEPAEIVAVAQVLLEDPEVAGGAAARDLSGLRFAVSAGGTHEHLDPVRYLGNASSGRMGTSLARAAALRGAEVTLVRANVDLPPPAGVGVEEVVSTGDLDTAMQQAAADADVVIMAAAPADFTPRQVAEGKLKKTGDAGLTLDLVQTTDVLAGLAADRRHPGQVVVGFAAETAPSADDLLELGRAKLARKGCDLLVLNDVSGGKVFGHAANEVVVLGADHRATSEDLVPFAGSKDSVAHHIVDRIMQYRASR